MSDFESIEEINEMFKMGNFTLPDSFTVSGFPYRMLKGVSYTIDEMLKRRYKLFLIYDVDTSSLTSEDWKKAHSDENFKLEEWIIFIWALTDKMSISPARAVTARRRIAIPDLQTAEKALAENRTIIPDLIDVNFQSFNKSIKAKVDTGADMSSLHCTNYKKATGKEILATIPDLSENLIRLDVIRDQVVKTSEGSKTRPVVSFKIEVEGKSMDIEMNLKNREGMEEKLLLGQIALEQGNFLIDPSLHRQADESIDWDALQEEYKDIEVEDFINISEESRAKTISLEDIIKNLK